MSPPIPRDWWLAAALTSAALPSVLAQPAPGGDRRPSGVVTTVAVEGTRTTSSTAPLYIDSAQGQKLSTGPNTTLHVLFPDQSALTVAPNTEIVITRFEFDSRTKQGNVLIDMTRGFLRVVGGLISKSSETRVRTSTATIGVRGGITNVEVEGDRTESTFLFGQHLRVAGTSGSEKTVFRPGFSITTDKDGIPSEPFRADVAQLTRTFNQSTPPGGSQGGQQGQEGGTLPQGANQPGDLASDRLPTSRDPGDVAGKDKTAPTLKQILENPAVTNNPS